MLFSTLSQSTGSVALAGGPRSIKLSRPWAAPTGWDRGHGPLLAGLELVRVQLVASQQLIEVRSITFRKACCLADVSHRDLQNLRKVVACKFIARIGERRELAAMLTK